MLFLSSKHYQAAMTSTSAANQLEQISKRRVDADRWVERHALQLPVELAQFSAMRAHEFREIFKLYALHMAHGHANLAQSFEHSFNRLSST